MYSHASAFHPDGSAVSVALDGPAVSVALAASLTSRNGFPHPQICCSAARRSHSALGAWGETCWPVVRYMPHRKIAQLMDSISINCEQWGQWTRIILLGMGLSWVERDDPLDELEDADAGGWMLETSEEHFRDLGEDGKGC